MADLRTAALIVDEAEFLRADFIYAIARSFSPLFSSGCFCFIYLLLQFGVGWDTYVVDIH